METMDVAVLGAGSWGTALAKTLADKGHPTALWGRDAEQIAAIRAASENAQYLPGAHLPPSLTATTDLAAALAGKKLVVLVVPSFATREVLAEARGAIPDDAVIVAAAKGIEEGTLKTMDEVLTEVLPERLAQRSVYLSGPSFAKEVAQRLPTAVVVASRDRHAAQLAQQAFNTDRFRVYTSDDVVGVEIGGALKNVMAIAAGIADGLGYGHNTRAALITRGIAEMTRLAIRRGANPRTLSGLAGVGDLVLTCTGDLSRNRTVGLKLGIGMKLADVMREMKQVAEGVRTTRSARELGDRLGVEMPITRMVYNTIYEDKPAAVGVVELLSRPTRHELE